MAKKKQSQETVIAYKGFDKNMQCRGFQYEVGKSYTHDGNVKACEAGFHACEHPLNVFDYYAPNESRFAVVELSGVFSREEGVDTKVAAGSITIKAEVGIPDLVASAVKWVMDRCTPEGSAATGYHGAASATGDHGAASATGYLGAASATGKASVALCAGYESRAMGEEGCAIFLVRRNEAYEITHVFASKVGENGIKPRVFYTLDEAGKAVEV